MANLAPIIYSADDPRNHGVAETINADAAPSLNAAFEQIHAESGIKPIVLRDLGGARTEAQQAHLVDIGESDTMNSDHREDFPGRAAADIDNQHELRAWNQDRFISIMAAHGWHNMTNSGAPFPKEPWHFAIHGVTPSGGGGTPINDTTTEEDDMKLITTSAQLTTLACPSNPSTSDVQWQIDTEYIQRSATAKSSATAQNLYGAGPENTHPMADLEEFQNTLWNHGISPIVVARLKPGQAWSAKRGIYNPGDDIPGNAKV